METTLATGLSKGKNGTVAAKEAVLRAKEKLGGSRVDLSIVYSSSDYDHREVVDVVREATNNAPLIGASSAGEFTAEKVERGSAENAGYSDFAGILVFDCAVRLLMLGDRFSESVDRFKKVLPGVPMLGWETYGEIRLEPGQFSGFHNTTSVVLLLPKGDRK